MTVQHDIAIECCQHWFLQWHGHCQQAAPAASTDLGTASSLNVAVSAASTRLPVLQSVSSKKLSRFAVESQRLQPPPEGLPPLAPATPLAARGDSVTSQVSAAHGASPARATTDEGDQWICLLPNELVTSCLLHVWLETLLQQTRDWLCMYLAHSSSRPFASMLFTVVLQLLFMPCIIVCYFGKCLCFLF